MPRQDVDPTPMDPELTGPGPDIPDLCEVDVVRHYTRLSQWNFGVDTGTYPLGSCTMKYNPKINETLAVLNGFSSAHPLLPASLAQGVLALMAELDEREAEVRKKHRNTVEMAGIKRNREEVLAYRAELRDLATLMECASGKRLSDEDIGALCRIYTRRAWPAQQRKILDILAKTRGAGPVIRRHVRAEREALPDIKAEIMALRGNTAKGPRLTIPYNKLLVLEKNIEEGISRLEGLGL